MSDPSPEPFEVRSVRYADVQDQAVWWCPGCDGPHAVPVSPGNRSPWTLSRTADGSPTLAPSILVHGWQATEPGFKSQPRCHSFIRAGSIDFLGDCEHALAGKIVPIPSWPELRAAL